MTSSLPPHAHLASVEVDALRRNREALRARPLDVSVMLAGCSHYRESGASMDVYYEVVESSGVDTVRPGQIFAGGTLDTEVDPGLGCAS